MTTFKDFIYFIFYLKIPSPSFKLSNNYYSVIFSCQSAMHFTHIRQLTHKQEVQTQQEAVRTTTDWWWVSLCFRYQVVVRATPPAPPGPGGPAPTVGGGVWVRRPAGGALTAECVDTGWLGVDMEKHLVLSKVKLREFHLVIFRGFLHFKLNFNKGWTESQIKSQVSSLSSHKSRVCFVESSLKHQTCDDAS